MRAVALWRLTRRDLFGEPQLVVHTGSDLAICREIQRGAWHWAMAHWGKDSVTKANGKEAIENPAGDRWIVRAQDAVYGYDVTLAMVDEGWDVKPEVVDEGLEPATMERSMPQTHMTSTAHRRATSLMRGRISTALAVDDPQVLLLLWGAPADADPSKVETWRAASAHWSEDRRELIARKYAAALAGQADPQADDPDPMAGFTAQYLNIWRLSVRREQRGEHVATEEEWCQLAFDTPDTPPTSVAVEAWFTGGYAIAKAWRSGDGVHVAVVQRDTLFEVATYLKALKCRRPVIVGKTLEQDPELRGIRRRAQTLRSGDAVTQLEAFMREDLLTHDGTEFLTEQVTGVRTLTGPDGVRVVSPGRTDAIKAVAWAVNDVRQTLTSTGKTGIMVPD